ncbi:aldo/keto reductase [Schlesneria paludicola]|uniref:aldo/keto reductase n=1 Tax=Schlesneria paludicola TaxID=360056 RepID=UPI00029A84DA|nr:aldo/keto reductase [Schlesneria paludicola]
MLTKAWKEFHLSRLMLGTVQFGLPYGVANRTGQPDFRHVVDMLSAAIEGGVNCFDTAAAYGTSEDVLGRALDELGAANRVTIVTKVRALTPAELADPQAARIAIEKSVSESRQRLRLDCLPVVLFHREADATYQNVLAELKAKGWLRYYGVSCDNRPGPAARFVADEHFSALQIPANILDPRHPRSGVFQAAGQRDVAIFIRSVYLQGLLVMPDEDIPPALCDVLPARHRLALLAADAGMDLAELALRYMLSFDDVTCVLAGVETVAQVEHNLAMVNRGPLPTDLLSRIAPAIPELPETIVNPGLWPPRKVD